MKLIRKIKNVLTPRFDIYECEECGHTFRVEPDVPGDKVACPECDSHNVRQVDLGMT